MLNSGDQFAGFTVQRLLGQGGMGSVFLARHPRLSRLVALKLLNRELYADPRIRARFEREADLCARLDHPNITAVYDRGVEDEQLWICMQYVDGIDAASVDPRATPPERAVQIVEGVAAALDYAHDNGVMHRDVKPANILLARTGAGKGERVYLTDFGIARLREDSTHLTQAGMFTATLAYASPEQMTGAELDHRSDQYSLACALYWLLTGTGPFDSEDAAAVINGHLQLRVPPASARRPGLSPAMDLVIDRAMAKHPAERFRDCSEFAAAAKQALTAPAPAGYAGPVPVPGMMPPGPAQPAPVPGYRVAAPQVGAAPPAGPHPAAGGGHPRAVLAPGGFPAPSGLPNAGAAQPYRQAPAPMFPGNVPGGHGAPKRAGAVGWFVAAAIVLLILVLAVGALLFFS